MLSLVVRVGRLRTIATEHVAWSATACDTDPSRKRSIVPRPCEPTTIQSAPNASASSRITRLAAEKAGFAAGDEWLGVEVESGVGTAKSASAWRISKLEEITFYAGNATKVKALVARDKRLLKLALTLPKAVTTWRLAVREPVAVARWLGS